MGKESLTKSTTKKKATTKKKKTEAKKAASAKKAAAPKAPAKPSLKEVLARKYAIASDRPLYSPPAPKRKTRPLAAASPFYEAKDEKDARRVKALLAQKFSMKDFQAAAEAKAKAEEEARKKAEAEAKAKAKAEEEARKKAEEEAKAKAEEEARKKAEAEAKATAEEEIKRLAAERAAAREAAAQKEPQVAVTYDKIESKEEKASKSSPKIALNREQMLIIGLAGGLALIFLLIIGASLSNSSKYYLKTSAQGLEIWQGKFAPLGQHKILSLPGVQAPETLQPKYGKADVMGYAVAYYLAQADNLLAQPGLPDFEAIKAELNTALGYATSRQERDRIHLRLDGIEKAIVLYKAQVAAAQQTLEGLDQAIKHFRQAIHLTSDPIEIQSIEAQIAAAEKNYADIEARLAEETAKETPPQEEAKPAN